METMTHFKKLRNQNFIGSYELMTGSEPIELVVKIDKAVKEQVQNGDKKEDAMVVYLQGQKPMIVNSTNAKSIAKALGTPFIEAWVGKAITLYVAKVRAFGESVDALRVRDVAPKAVVAAKPELNPSHPKWAGALKALAEKNTTIEAVQKAYSISSANLKTLQDAVTK